MSSERQPAYPHFLTIAEVAHMTRLSKATVYRLIQKHEIPAVQFGRSYRVTEKAVEDYIAHAAVDEAPTYRQ